MGCSFRLAARVLLYASPHRQDSTKHGLCYTSRGALAGTINKTGSVLDYHVLYKKCLLVFIVSNLSFEYRGMYYTYTISNQITGIYWPGKKHFITSSLIYVTNGILDFVKCCIKCLLDLRPDNTIWWITTRTICE